MSISDERTKKILTQMTVIWFVLTGLMLLTAWSYAPIPPIALMALPAFYIFVIRKNKHRTYAKALYALSIIEIIVAIISFVFFALGGMRIAYMIASPVFVVVVLMIPILVLNLRLMRCIRWMRQEAINEAWTRYYSALNDPNANTADAEATVGAGDMGESETLPIYNPALALGIVSIFTMLIGIGLDIGIGAVGIVTGLVGTTLARLANDRDIRYRTELGTVLNIGGMILGAALMIYDITLQMMYSNTDGIPYHY
jgi:hypothetical protein